MSALQMGGGRCFLRASLIVTLLFSVQLCHLSYGMPDWYNCTADNCVAPDCMCASIAPPGGLAPEETPQFILITHDDAINPLSDKVIRSVTNGRVNPNGCNVPATWFTLQLGSDCAFVKKLWEQNHEIALHTVTHAALYLNYEGKEAEMMGVQEWLNSTCGIPLEDLVGYRTPYLVHNAEVREIMEAEGLLYDSSMISVFSEDSLVSTKPGERVFPFTMDHGIPINCNWNYPDGQCDPQQEKYPGLWEIPLWELQNQAGDHLYTMDPKGDVFSLLQENFKMNYDNNRAPFGIFVHATWFDAYTTGALNKFLDWAQEQPDVWLVTATQLLKWMQDPVPASQMGEWLTCRPVNLTAVNAEARCQLYTVQDGDSSYNIATKFGIVTDDLLSENPEVGSGDALSVGDELRIPPFGSDCVGDAVKRVTGPGQVELTEIQPTEGAQGTETVADICGPGLYENLAPIAGINVTMMLEGRPEVAFQTDLKSPLESAIALGLGIENYHGEKLLPLIIVLFILKMLFSWNLSFLMSTCFNP